MVLRRRPGRSEKNLEEFMPIETRAQAAKMEEKIMAILAKMDEKMGAIMKKMNARNKEMDEKMERMAASMVEMN